MPLSVAAVLVNLLLLYLGVGLVFAVAFVVRGIAAVDPVAREGTLGFKILVFPGCVAFWPWLLKRWIRGEPPKDESNAHRRAAAPRPTGDLP